MLFLLLFHVLFALTLGFFADVLVITPWFIIFNQLVRFLLPLVIWLLFKKEKLITHLPKMRMGKINLILILFLSIFLQPVMMLLSGISSLFFPNQVSEMVSGMMSQPFWLLILAFAVTPAICEEIIFRGYIQSAYRNRPILTTALINGFFFAVIHLSFQQFLYVFVMGVIFAYIVHYTRSIIAGILMHFVMNASQLAFSWWVNQNIVPPPEDYTFSFIEQLSALMGPGLVALLATPCAVILFKSFLSHNRQRNIEYDMQTLIDEQPKTTAELIKEPPKPSPLKSIDPFFIGVVVLYVVLMILF